MPEVTDWPSILSCSRRWGCWSSSCYATRSKCSTWLDPRGTRDRMNMHDRWSDSCSVRSTCSRAETIQSRMFPKESADFGSAIPKFVSSISTDPELRFKNLVGHDEVDRVDRENHSIGHQEGNLWLPLGWDENTITLSYVYWFWLRCWTSCNHHRLDWVVILVVSLISRFVNQCRPIGPFSWTMVLLLFILHSEFRLNIPSTYVTILVTTMSFNSF